MGDFDDLLTANQRFADTFDRSGLEGRAAAGVAVVTCMDSRIDPLALLGLGIGDVKVVRNPGGRVTPEALEALVLATHLLGVERVLVVPHTRCAVATSTEEQLREKVATSAGQDVSWQSFPPTADQRERLLHDVDKVRNHPLVPDTVKVGGFVYDVDTGLLQPVG